MKHFFYTKKVNCTGSANAQRSCKLLLVCLIFLLSLPQLLFAQQKMENLGRGTVALRSSSSQVFISWRILGLEFNSGVKYNLYRGSTRIASNLNVSNYLDNTSTNSTYQVAAVVGGVEQAKSPAVSVTTTIHGTNTIPCIQVPIVNTPGYTPKMIYCGDLDGNGEMDFVLINMPSDASKTIYVEAYKRDGTFLWRLDCGPNSLNRDNIEPGSSALNVGHGDNMTVYDLNSDGKAEVIVRVANGVKFGDGTTFSAADNNRQYIAVLNGMTGSLLGYKAVPTNYLADGPMSGHMGIAYLNGSTPSVIWSSKNRIGSGNFNMMVTAYSWAGNNVNLQWTFLRGNQNLPDGHNIRLVDVTGDGKDEIFPFGHVINPDGTLRYSLGITAGMVHGDRFHVGDLDPARPGLEGYAIQQDNPSGLAWVYFDAKTGAVIKNQVSGVGDYARGFAGDLDPNYPGYEFWTFTDGIYNISGTKTSTVLPASYPNLRIWWDGDALSENLDNYKMTKWNHTSSSETRLYTFKDVTQWDRNVPGLYGDILGDWREEVVYLSSDKNKLLIFTPLTTTSIRMYTLLHNPAYRNCLTTKGYYQSNMADCYIGNGMAAPATPNIQYVPASTTLASRDLDSPMETTNLIANVENKGTPSVFPNPSDSDFSLSAAGKFSYEVYDATGKLMEEGRAEDKVRVGVRYIPGMYIIKIQTDAGDSSQFKVLKK